MKRAFFDSCVRYVLHSYLHLFIRVCPLAFCNDGAIYSPWYYILLLPDDLERELGILVFYVDPEGDGIFASLKIPPATEVVGDFRCTSIKNMGSLSLLRL